MFSYAHKFFKINLSKYEDSILNHFVLYEKNLSKIDAYNVIHSYFGKPNANKLRNNETTWKYILEYKMNFFSIYDFSDTWSLGFIEIKNIIPDYQVIHSIASMLHKEIKNEISRNLEKTKTIIH